MPLHLAASQGEVKAAQFLLSKGAELDATDNSGPGPQRQGQKSRLQLGAPQKGFQNWNSEKKVCISASACQSCGYPPQKVWNQWSQYNMSICVENGWSVDFQEMFGQIPGSTL